jgi:hypothetical protein
MRAIIGILAEEKKWISVQRFVSILDSRAEICSLPYQIMNNCEMIMAGSPVQ